MLRRAACGIAAALVLAVPAWAGASLATRLARALAEPHVAAAESGALAVDLATGKVVFSRHPSLSLAPASNEKLAVTYAALVRLGPAFRFRTEVLGEGEQDGHVWRGNLVLCGYGDPTLTTLGLKRLAAQLKTAGIRHVSGSIVGDETFFDSRRMVAGWKASFYGDESPPLSALTINRGRVKGILVDEPARATARRFREILVARGITVAGGVETRAATPDAYPLANLYSDPLAEILHFMDQRSDNFTAELVLKELGAVVGGTGTSAAGAQVVVDALREARVPLDGVRIVDGSGLSRADRLTVRALVAILQASWSDSVLRRTLLSSLPVAGVSGTLEHRLQRLPARGHVRAKTGTTDLASSLSGFVGDRYAFAIVHNGHPVWSWYARAAQDRFVQTLAAAARAPRQVRR